MMATAAATAVRVVRWQPPWGGDPMDLTPEVEYLRCRESFAYFLHFVTVDNPQRGGAVKFERWPYLLEIAQSWQRGENCIEGKARQLGYSWLVAAFALWVITFRDGARVLAISMGVREASALVDKVKFIHDNLPTFLALTYTKANSEDVELAGSRGAIKILPSTPNAGSGFTATVVITDEWAKHPFAGANFAAFRPAIADGGQHIAISTGNGPSGMFAEYYNDPADNGYVRRFNGWSARPDRDQSWYENERKAYASSGLGDQRFMQENPTTPEEMFRVFEGQVFTDYLYELHGSYGLPDKPIPFTWQQSKLRVGAVDPGQGDPAAFVPIGQNAEGFAFQFGEWTNEGATSYKEIIDAIMPWHRLAPFHAIICDKSEGTLIATLRAAGLPAVGSADFADREIGIGVVKAFLVSMQYGHIASATVTRREFGSYRFRMRRAPGETDQYATSTPVDHHGDHLDCIRWILMALSQGRTDFEKIQQPSWLSMLEDASGALRDGMHPRMPDLAGGKVDKAAARVLVPNAPVSRGPVQPDFRVQGGQPSFAPRSRSPVSLPLPGKRSRGW